MISHDERFITAVAKEVNWAYLSVFVFWLDVLAQLWVCGDGTTFKFKGDVQSYKVRSNGV